MVAIIEGLCESAVLRAGDRVRTLRGSLRGVVNRVLPDGKVVWQADGSASELTALPEALLRESQPQRP